MPDIAVMQDPFIDSEQESRSQIAEDRSEFHRPSLLEQDEHDAATQMFEEWAMQDKMVRNDAAQWKVNKLREAGFTGVHVVKAQDENRAFVPIGAVPSFVAMNKAARLKRRLASVLYADEAIPDPIPASDDNESRDSAAFARHLLVGQSGESGLDFHRMHRRSFDKAGNFGSGLIYFRVEERGTFEPITVMAHPQAETLQDATIDPQTGLKATGELVRRFLRQDGTLAKELDETVQFDWFPKLETHLLTGQHVRFHPHTSIDIWDAEGASIGMMLPLGLVRASYPVLDTWNEDALQKLVEWRPTHFEELLPYGQKDRHTELKGDERLVFVLTRFQRQGPDYPKGALLVAVGGPEHPVLLDRTEWYDHEHMKALDIPISQVKQINDDDRPMGRAIMEFMGPGNEIRAAMMEAMLEWLDRFKNAKVYVPMTSNLQAKQAQAAMGTHVPIVPGGQPVTEEVPPFPDIIKEMFILTTDDLDDESGLQESGQALEAANVKSGVHAQTVLSQVIIGLSDMRQNAARAQERSWRIALQLYRAFFDRPQRVTWESENGQHREKEWIGSDLNGVRDVRILPGSFTQLLPIQKDALVQGLLGTQRITPKEARRLTVSNIGGLVRLDDDPHLLRVRGQVSRWEEGPPKGWEPPKPTQGHDGQPVLPRDPALFSIFDPRPTDDIPEIALTRMEELGAALAGNGFQRWPPMWQRGLVQEFERARRAAGVATIAEQQEARRQQIEAERQAQEQERAARMQEKSVDAIEQVQKAEIESASRERQEETKAAANIAAQALGKGVSDGGAP